jgi:hypothetical protein
VTISIGAANGAVRIIWGEGRAYPSTKLESIIKPGEYRYWRIYVQTNNGDASFISMGEVELRDAIGGQDSTHPDNHQ